MHASWRKYSLEACRAQASLRDGWLAGNLLNLASMHVHVNLQGSIHCGSHCMQGLTAKGVAVHPQPLSPTFFSDRIDAVDAKVSGKLFEALKQAGLLNGDGHLKDDPR